MSQSNDDDHHKHTHIKFRHTLFPKKFYPENARNFCALDNKREKIKQFSLIRQSVASRHTDIDTSSERNMERDLRPERSSLLFALSQKTNRVAAAAVSAASTAVRRKHRKNTAAMTESKLSENACILFNVDSHCNSL